MVNGEWTRIGMVFAIHVEDEVRTTTRRSNARNFLLSMSVFMALNFHMMRLFLMLVGAWFRKRWSVPKYHWSSLMVKLELVASIPTFVHVGSAIAVAIIIRATSIVHVVKILIPTLTILEAPIASWSVAIISKWLFWKRGVITPLG
jgi:hypothetical protein